MLKKLLFVFLIMVTGAWLVADELFLFTAARPVILEIPDFCGRSLGSIEEGQAEWCDLSVEYRYDERTPVGNVIAQEPVAGSRRKRPVGETVEVKLTVSLGKETVTLPRMVGEREQFAVSRLCELGCSTEVVYRESARPSGEVLSMEPRAEAVVPKGTRVLLTVSAGVPEKSVTVPSLIGLSRSDALVKLWMSGLSLETVADRESDPEKVGLVIGQSHLAGTVVPAGTRVTLYVGRE